MTSLLALPYYGGKSAGSPYRSGRWITGMLPTDTECYVEPFAGMLGVLHQRPKVKREVANDRHFWLIDWWRVVRDRGDELAEVVELTSYSEGEHQRAVEAWRAGFAGKNEVERARLITVLFWQTYGGMEWGASWCPTHSHTQARPRSGEVGKRLRRLCERLIDVELYCRDAVEVASRYADKDEAVMYLDPPYETADTSGYEIDNVDRGHLTEILRAATARCAISGYGDEWDRLGWERHTYNTYLSAHLHVADQNAGRAKRVEVLWTNFTPSGQQALL